MASLPTLRDGIALTHFFVAEDVERAAHFRTCLASGYDAVLVLKTREDRALDGASRL
jgi:hypothetical protein